MPATVKTALLATLIASLCACTTDLLEPEVWHPPGQNVELDDIKIRYAHIGEAPGGEPHVVGADVPAFVWLYNEKPVMDALVEVTTPAATEVSWVTESGKVVTEPFELPPRSHRALEPGGPHLMLIDLTRQLRGGDFVDMTFRFARAGEVTIPVPVQVAGYDSVLP